MARSSPAPILSGSLTTADPLHLRANSPLELQLEFRCEAEGTLAVTVNVRFTNAGAVQWTVRKRCSPPTEAEEGGEEGGGRGGHREKQGAGPQPQ